MTLRPPRIPDTIMRLFPRHNPPKSPHFTWVDAAATVAVCALMAASLFAGPFVFGVALVLLAVYAWRAVLGVVHGQQLADWMNSAPDPADVPDVEQP